MWYHNTHISITLTATNRLTERIVILAVNSGQQPPPLFTCGNARRLMSANTLADSRQRTHTIHPHHTCCRPGWNDQLQGVTVLRYLESSCNSERPDLYTQVSLRARQLFRDIAREEIQSRIC